MPGRFQPRTACAVVAWFFVLIAASPSAAQTFSSLHSFDYFTDGAHPVGGLVQSTDGNLYGTTSGEVNADGGTIFKITTSGALTTLYDFCSTGGVCLQDRGSRASLLLATNGKLYGTTFGVAGSSGDPGAIFELNGGAVTTVYSFCTLTGCSDGENPYAGVIEVNGNLYGTTEFGGHCDNAFGCGTVFTVTGNGVLKTLYTFCKAGGSCPDGEDPFGGLVQADNGSFYGTTASGGGSNLGTFFRITPKGKLTAVAFCSRGRVCSGGPEAAMIEASDGNLYGTAFTGGTGAYGTMFRISSSGTLTTVYNFCSQRGCTDGATPDGGLIQASDGNLYGTTSSGGAHGYGTIFKVAPATGQLTTLYSFCSQSGCADGAGPVATLTQDTDGAFYGTTTEGGTHGAFGYGTIFRLSVGLSPFVKTLPTSGAVGTSVRILGTDLTGATNVAFNSTPATFTVVSSSEIQTAVPSGATTGLVEVNTPKQALKSNVVFRVVP